MTKRSTQSALAVVAGAMADVFRAAPGATPAMKPSPPSTPKVYFADNSRLRPNAGELRRVAEAICGARGLVAEWPSEHFLFPLDPNIPKRAGAPQVPGEKEQDDLRKLLGKSWRIIGGCDAMVAEVTPFRGEHLNPVVAFEIGVAVVYQIPIFAWTTAKPRRGHQPFDLLDRVWCCDKIASDGYWRDETGDLVENFGLVEYASIAGNFCSVSITRADAIAGAALHFKRLAAGVPGEIVY
jgi:nucleoside 2-deoxyribosyltransferase